MVNWDFGSGFHYDMSDRRDGGPGSGNFGHKGVPGQVGGSAPNEGGGSSGGDRKPPKKMTVHKSGTINGYSVGQSVPNLKYEGNIREGKIKTITEFPNGAVEYMVEFPATSYSKEGTKKFSEKDFKKAEEELSKFTKAELKNSTTDLDEAIKKVKANNTDILGKPLKEKQYGLYEKDERFMVIPEWQKEKAVEMGWEDISFIAGE